MSERFPRPRRIVQLDTQPNPTQDHEQEASKRPVEYNTERILAAPVPDMETPEFKQQLTAELGRLSSPDRASSQLPNYHREILEQLVGSGDSETQAELIRMDYPNPADFVALAESTLNHAYESNAFADREQHDTEWLARAGAPADLARVIYGNRYKEYANQRDAIDYGVGPYRDGILDTLDDQPQTQELDNQPSDTTIDAPVDIQDIIEESVDHEDATNRYKDVELLRGKRVRLWIHEAGNQHIRRLELVQAKWQNARDTPGKLRKAFSHSVAKNRYENHKKRLKNSAGHQRRKDAINDHKKALEKLGNSKLDQLRRGKIEAKLAKVEGKVKRAEDKLAVSKSKMKRAEKSYNRHTKVMDKRLSRVDKNAEKRREAYIRELKDKREAALANRALRHELHAQGAKRHEVNMIMRDIPKEHLQRVGRIALQTETSRRNAQAAERATADSSAKAANTLSAIGRNEKKTRKYAENAKNASQTAKEIETKALPDAREQLKTLHDELKELLERENSDPEAREGDNSDTEAREALQNKIQEVEQQIDLYIKREIPYWQNVARESRRHVVDLENEQARLQEQFRTHQEQSAHSSERADALNSILDQDIQAQQRAAETALTDERT